jgi:putative endonuclease
VLPLSDSATQRLTVMLDRKPISARDLGRLGENRAVWYLRLRGYSIVDRNVRSQSGEIDIVARRGSVLAFVEVKTRQTLAAGEPHRAVHREKQLRIARLAAEYVARHDLAECAIRFDVVSAFWNGRRFIVTHYPDAFRPMADPDRPWRMV